MFLIILKTELTVHVLSKGLIYYHFFFTILWVLVLFFFYLFFNFCVLAIPGERLLLISPLKVTW